VGLVSRDPQIPGGFVVTNRRAYDAWGLVRQGAAAAEPWQRYCGNLGHVQDDKSGLIYMRARYYEPWSGRFVSEDPARDGLNWYSYCKNDPVNSSDASGKFAITLGLALAGFIIGFLTGGITALLGGQGGLDAFKSALASGIGGFAAGLFPVSAFGAGAISAFVSSIAGNLFAGRAIRWGRAFMAAGVGGLAGAILNAVCSIGARSEKMSKLADMIDDCDQFDEVLGILAVNIVSSAYDAFDP
jgi:RHS repeat-associated protein